MTGSNRLGGLVARPKPSAVDDLRKVDEVGEARGFVDRTARMKPGRKPSPRTYQMHPKVLPQVGAEISQEAETLGLTQGQLIEKMWQTYLLAMKTPEGGRRGT